MIYKRAAIFIYIFTGIGIVEVPLRYIIMCLDACPWDLCNIKKAVIKGFCQRDVPQFMVKIPI